MNAEQSRIVLNRVTATINLNLLRCEHVIQLYHMLHGLRICIVKTWLRHQQMLPDLLLKFAHILRVVLELDCGVNVVDGIALIPLL